MWNALGQALPQAVGIAISPIPVVLVILMLVSAKARSNGPAFGAGWVAGVLLVTGLAFVLADGADVATDPDAADGGSIVQLILGVAFFVLAVRQWRGRPRPGVDSPPPKLFAAVDSFTPPKAAGLGFLAAAANPKNLPLAISAGVTISQAGATGGSGMGAVIVFAVVASVSVLVPVVAVLVMGARSQPILESLKGFLLANNATIMTVLFTVLGAKMLGSGLAITA
jgi:hypothetical protein